MEVARKLQCRGAQLFVHPVAVSRQQRLSDQLIGSSAAINAAARGRNIRSEPKQRGRCCRVLNEVEPLRASM